MRISGSNAGYTMFRGSVKGTGYLLHSPVPPSFPLTCVTVCHHISTGVYSIMKILTVTRLGFLYTAQVSHLSFGNPDMGVQVNAVVHNGDIFETISAFDNEIGPRGL